MVATPQTEPQFRIRVETEGTVLYRRRIICDDPDKVSLANHLRQQRRHVNSVTVLQIGMIVEVHATTSWPAVADAIRAYMETAHGVDPEFSGSGIAALLQSEALQLHTRR